MDWKHPRVGVWVLVVKDNKILVWRRKSNLWDGTWWPPGGHLEFWESFEECAKRETEEEADIQIENVKFLTVVNDFYQEKHYVTISMISDYKSGVVKLTNFDEHYEWDWFSVWDLPKNLFYPFQNFINIHQDLLEEIFGSKK